ncbi:MAG TPA: YafY family protein [Chitinophagaceae bacterium]|nr:YafY family protein [Chitinophagaceae bacterium]
MNRIDRLMGMIVFLQSRRFSRVHDLCAKFGISQRTAYRDIKALGEIGIPVHLEPGKGYFIAQGFFLPPLSFTREEANSLLLLKVLANRFADYSIAKHSDSAFNKIRAILKYQDKDRIDNLSSKTIVYLAGDEKYHNGWLSAIQNAIASQTVLRIRYTDNNGAVTTREIEPVGLIFYTSQWHLYAWCLQRGDYRDFKVKMISQLINTGKLQSSEEHLSIEDYIKTF